MSASARPYRLVPSDASSLQTYRVLARSWKFVDVALQGYYDGYHNFKEDIESVRVSHAWSSGPATCTLPADGLSTGRKHARVCRC